MYNCLTLCKDPGGELQVAAGSDDGGLRLQAAQRGRTEVGDPPNHRPGEPGGEVSVYTVQYCTQCTVGSVEFCFVKNVAKLFLTKQIN